MDQLDLQLPHIVPGPIPEQGPPNGRGQMPPELATPAKLSGPGSDGGSGGGQEMDLAPGPSLTAKHSPPAPSSSPFLDCCPREAAQMDRGLEVPGPTPSTKALGPAGDRQVMHTGSTAVEKEERTCSKQGEGPAGFTLFCPRPEQHLGHWAAPLGGDPGPPGGGFQPKVGVLPGGGTPEARHSKVTEAFSSTALLTGPGSMLGGTEEDKKHPGLVGVSPSSSDLSHADALPSLPEGSWATRAPKQLMPSDQGSPRLNQVQEQRR